MRHLHSAHPHCYMRVVLSRVLVQPINDDMLNKYTWKKSALSESAKLNLKAKARHGQPETVQKWLKVPYSVKVPIGNEKEAISKSKPKKKMVMWLVNGREGGKGDGVLNWTSSGVIGERDEEVPLVDCVFEGALGALGDES
ncbi:hypothetical protein Tco_0581935 [Tanacetum coccineum]